MESVKFSGQDCVPLENGLLKLLITQSVGPRILFLAFRGSRNLLAELPDFVSECPGGWTFHFYGGHRLWDAPEDMARTYLPDDSPVDVTPLKDGIVVTQVTHPRTGLQKSIEIVLESGTSRVVLTHRLTNRGVSPLTCAPWAITQFRTGGVAILPQASEDTGLLPNRSLALWPYTDLVNPHVTLAQSHILVEANLEGPLKLGFPNPHGWLAYWLDGILFVKRAPFDAQAAYYDYGSSSEFYCNQRFLELETLAPVGTIPPDGSATHVETWELFADIERPHNVQDAQALAAALGLG